jgi:glycosyltransferase involved in cell wall biosynthesis
MRIAILGTRGIPNHYGGFEQYAELLATYLVRQGWEVVVYNSSDHPYKEKSYKGVAIQHVHDPEEKWGTVGQFVYDLGCIKDTRKQRFDLVYQLGYTSSAIFNFLFPKGTTIVTNMDGFEWQRTKYGKSVQRFLKYSEGLVVRKSHYLVADSLPMQAYITKKYQVTPFYSAYTAVIPTAFDPAILQQYNLSERGYDLLIARMEPENNIKTIIMGHLESNTDRPLIVVGSLHAAYGQYISKKYNSDKIRFVGAIYDKAILDTMRHYACLYFHGHSVGGTNPSLLEAMACSCTIIAHDNEFNKGVLGTDAVYFKDAGYLAGIIDSATIAAPAVTNNLRKITDLYSEDYVFSQLKDQLYEWHTERNQRVEANR